MEEIPFGIAKARILNHTVREIGDKEAVEFRIEHPCGAVMPMMVWLSPKAMGMARASLKKCGFDPDTQDIQELVDDPKLLEGNLVEIMVQDYKDKRQASVNLRSTPPKTRLSAITKGLREAKKDRDEEPPPPADDDLPF